MASVGTQWGDSVNVPDIALDLNHSDGVDEEEEERGAPRQQGSAPRLPVTPGGNPSHPQEGIYDLQFHSVQSLSCV